MYNFFLGPKEKANDLAFKGGANWRDDCEMGHTRLPDGYPVHITRFKWNLYGSPLEIKRGGGFACWPAGLPTGSPPERQPDSTILAGYGRD